jgi:predicted PurR-regulated permease PerM
VSVLPHSFQEQRPRSVAGTLIATGVVIALLYFGRAFLITLITAITISFLLEPFVELVMRLRVPRSVASFIVCTITLLIVYAFGVGTYSQAAALWEDLPKYSQRISEIADEVAAKLESAEQDAYRVLMPRRWRELEELRKKQAAPPPEPPTARRRRAAEPPLPVAPPPTNTITEVRIRPERSPLVDYLYRNWQQFYNFGLLASFVPFLVYFMLSWRDHLRRSYLQLFQGPDRHAAGRSWQGIADMARAYVVGNFVLGLFLTGASGLFFWFISLPYFLLVAPLSAFFSLVPYIGLPLAMLPPFLAALPVYNRMAPYLVIAAVVGFLHLLALNLLYPKLVGSRVHLNPLAVTVALMFWGSLWGAIGLVFAIPITAGMKAVFDNIPALQPYGKLLGD